MSHGGWKVGRLNAILGPLVTTWCSGNASTQARRRLRKPGREDGSDRCDSNSFCVDTSCIASIGARSLVD